MHTASRAQVIVIGAGLAGLVAAYELRKAGVDVLVLEARDRPGGRVLTLRTPFANHRFAEAGARYVLAHHDTVRQYARELEVALSELPPPATADVSFFMRGRKLRVPYDEGATWARECNLTAADCRDGLAGLYRRYIAPTLEELGDPRVNDWRSPRHVQLDVLTFSEFLRAQGASDDAVYLLSTGTYDIVGDGVDSVSALALLRREALLRGSPAGIYTIDGGSDALPLALAQTLDDHVKYRCPVRRVDQTGPDISVSCVCDQRIQIFHAQHVLCAVPFPLLRDIEFEPVLSPSKAQMIAQLPQTSVCRVYLQCSPALWLDEPENFIATDLPIMHLYCMHAGRDTTDSRILEAYMTGSRARYTGGLDERERIDFVLTQVQRIYPAIRDYFLQGASYFWDTAAWSRGAFAWFRPGQLTRWSGELAASEARIHFAGDHTSILPGWMEGAMQSGCRAAHSILADL